MATPPDSVSRGGKRPLVRDEATPAPKRPANTVQSRSKPPSQAETFNGGSDFGKVRAQASRKQPPPVKLPPILMQGPGVKVKSGDDAGDFYCEHTTFVLMESAKQKGSSVLRDQGGRGDPMTGFLHLPSDPATFEPPSTPPKYDLAQRMGPIRQVVGAAFRSFADQAMAQVPKGKDDAPVRLQLTGYGPFGTVQNNPTGEFVSHRENLDAAMDSAYGPNLVRGKDGQPAVKESQLNGDALYEYRVRDPRTNEERRVQVLAAKMDVADTAIDNGPRSVQQKLRDFQPHAALSMGVYPGETDFRAEFRADTGGMIPTGNGGWKEGPAGTKRESGPNYAVGRAIWLGNQTIQRERPTPAPRPAVS